MKRWIFGTLLTMGLFWQAALLAIIVDDGSDLSGALDLTGVGLADNGSWVTLVSDQVVISANHYHPSVGTAVTFTDEDNNTVIRLIANGYNIPGTDIWLGTLDSEISSLSIYSYMTETISSLAMFGPNTFGNSDLYNADAYLLGHDSGINTDITVGTNIVEGFQSVDVDGVMDDALLTVFDQQIPATSEAQLQGGDSGAPLFIDDGSGGLLLAGINWFIGSNGAGEDLSGASYVGNDSSEITTYIASVPEPSTMFLLWLSSGIFASYSRRGQRRF